MVGGGCPPPVSPRCRGCAGAKNSISKLVTNISKGVKNTKICMRYEHPNYFPLSQFSRNTSSTASEKCGRVLLGVVGLVILTHVCVTPILSVKNALSFGIIFVTFV